MLRARFIPIILFLTVILSIPVFAASDLLITGEIFDAGSSHSLPNVKVEFLSSDSVVIRSVNAFTEIYEPTPWGINEKNKGEDISLTFPL